MESFDAPISNLQLSVRSMNCLRNAEIRTVGQLVRKTRVELLKTKHCGRKSLAEIEDALTSLGLRLGMSDDDDDAPMVAARR
jgi:DNA-directed RNA polymerase subunit alpha